MGRPKDFVDNLLRFSYFRIFQNQAIQIKNSSFVFVFDKYLHFRIHQDLKYLFNYDYFQAHVCNFEKQNKQKS